MVEIGQNTSPMGQCKTDCADDDSGNKRYKFLPTALCVYGDHTAYFDEDGNNDYFAPNDFCSDANNFATSHHLRVIGASDSAQYEKDYIHLDGYGVWHDFRKGGRNTDGTQDTSEGPGDSGHLGAGWFTYQDMCISDCRDTATHVIANKSPVDDVIVDTYGGSFFEMYQVAIDGAQASDGDRTNYLDDTQDDYYPVHIYNDGNECRARCAIASLDDGEDLDLFAHPETHKCVRVCPIVNDVSYYAQIGSQTCDTAVQCKTRDKLRYAEGNDYQVAVFHRAVSHLDFNGDGQFDANQGIDDLNTAWQTYLSGIAEASHAGSYSGLNYLTDTDGDTRDGGYETDDELKVTEWFTYTGVMKINNGKHLLSYHSLPILSRDPGSPRLRPGSGRDRRLVRRGQIVRRGLFQDGLHLDGDYELPL